MREEALGLLFHWCSIVLLVATLVLASVFPFEALSASSFVVTVLLIGLLAALVILASEALLLLVPVTTFSRAFIRLACTIAISLLLPLWLILGPAFSTFILVLASLLLLVLESASS